MRESNSNKIIDLVKSFHNLFDVDVNSEGIPYELIPMGIRCDAVRINSDDPIGSWFLRDKITYSRNLFNYILSAPMFDEGQS